MVKIQNNSELVKSSALIIGGGIAGIFSAVLLQEKGYKVSLIEKRKFLGGRTYSTKKTESVIDNGQHLLMGCYDKLLNLLTKIGSIQKVNFQDEFYVKIIAKNGKTGIIKDSKYFPNGMMLLLSLLKYPYISSQEKLRIIFVLLKIKFINRNNKKFQNISFFEWLKRNGQSDKTINNFWNLVILPTLNDHVKDVSADMGLMVFQESILKGNKYAKLGFPIYTLDDIVADPSRKHIEGNGGEIYLGKSVEKILYKDNKVIGVSLKDGSNILADIVVTAIPPNALYEILPEQLLAIDFFTNLLQIKYASIVNIYLWLNKKIMKDLFVNIIDSPLQWIFNKSPTNDTNQLLNISISSGEELLSKSKNEIIDLVSQELQEIFPEFQLGFVERFKIIKERKATFRCSPNSRKYRLTNNTPVDNLYITGDWVDTGWPSTMESAALSAYNAIHLVTPVNK